MMNIIAAIKAPKNRYLVISASLAAVLLVVVLAIIFIPRSDSANLSAEETHDILGEVIKNNPKGVIVSDNTKNAKNLNPIVNSGIPIPDISSEGEVEPLSPDDIIAPDLNTYNYRYTKTTYIKGNYTQCSANYGEYTSEYYEYFDVGRSYYKSVQSDEDENISSVSIAKYGTSEDESYSYAGGKFAVKQVYKPYENFSNSYRLNPASYTVDQYQLSGPVNSDGSSSDVNVEGYFPSNAKVTRIYTQNGKKYLEIEVDSTYYCNNDYYSSGIPSITVYKVDNSNYQIVQTDIYAYSISNSKLIRTVKSEAKTDKVAFNEVKSDFEYSYSPLIEEVNYRDYVYDAEKRSNEVKNYLTTSGINLFYVDETGFELTSFNGVNYPERVKNEKYYYDRGYYSSDSKGQQKYDSIINSRNSSELIYASFYSNTLGKYLSINVYDSQYVTLGQLKNYRGSRDYIRSADNVSISINNQPVTVYKTLENYYLPVSYPVSYPISYPISYPYYYYSSSATLYFQYGDKNLVVSSYIRDVDDIGSFSYKSESVSNSTKAQNLIDKYFSQYQ